MKFPLTRRFLTRAMLALATVGALFGVACGGGDDDDASPAAAASAEVSPAATNSATVSRDATPTAAETQWMTALCALEVQSDTAQDALPEASQDTSTMTLEQRRTRASNFWPALAEIEDEFVAGMRALTPPESGAAIHAAIQSRSETLSTEMRRSFANIDAIFATVESVEANNDVLDASEQAGNVAVDEAFDASPALIDLYDSIPDCNRRRPPTE